MDRTCGMPRRADGTLRLGLDYRKLNEASEPATLHPIPLIDDLLDRLASVQYFSVLDAKAGYHQMPLKKEDSEVTAFVVPHGGNTNGLGELRLDSKEQDTPFNG